MKTLTLLLTAAALTFGQSFTMQPGRLMLRPGDSTTVTLSVSGQSTPTITALQWTETATGITTSLPILSGTAASKSIACSTPGASKVCLVYSVGTTTIANGQIAVATITIPVNAAAGTLTYGVSNTLGANASGNAVTLIPPAPISFTVVGKYDLNADGKTDIVDVNFVVQQAIGNQPVSICDVNNDGVCNVQDVALVAANATP